MNTDKIALVTGADRGLGRALTESLLVKGWTVLAGQYLEWPELGGLKERFPDSLHILPLDVSSGESVREAAAMSAGLVNHIDLFIANAALNRSHQIQTVRQELNFDDMLAEVNTNAIGAVRLVHEFLPLIEKSDLKRLCFVSSEAGSIGSSQRTGWFGYCMSKAAMNMAVKNMANDLGPQGFDFRLYHPGYLKTYMSGIKNEAAHMEPEQGAELALDYFLSDAKPNTLVLRDYEGNEFPW